MEINAEEMRQFVVSETRERITHLEAENKVLRANMEVMKAEDTKSYERLQAAIARQGRELAVIIIGSIGVATAILGVVLYDRDTSSQTPIIIYSNQLPAVQAPATPPPTTSAN